MTSALVWVTGLPSSGKTTFALALRQALELTQIPSLVLDGDRVRRALVPNLGYGRVERDHFYETLANLGALLAEQGFVVIVPATANRRLYRDRARRLVPRFIEVWLAVSLAECRRRDAKGLYALAGSAAVTELPGADAEYEPPNAPEITGDGGTDRAALERTVALLRA